MPVTQRKVQGRVSSVRNRKVKGVIGSVAVKGTPIIPSSKAVDIGSGPFPLAPAELRFPKGQATLGELIDAGGEVSLKVKPLAKRLKAIAAILKPELEKGVVLPEDTEEKAGEFFQALLGAADRKRNVDVERVFAELVLNGLPEATRERVREAVKPFLAVASVTLDKLTAAVGEENVPKFVDYSVGSRDLTFARKPAAA